MCLHSLFQQSGTDKAQHGYAPYYEAHLGSRRQERLTFWELGTAHGASMRAWRRWLPNAILLGVDQWDQAPGYLQGICPVVTGDLASERFLSQLAQRPQRPDVIVDDASHCWLDQARTLTVLWPALNHNGWYVIEDLHTSYWSLYRRGTEPPFTNVLGELVHSVQRQGGLPSLRSLHVYKSIAFLHKAPAEY